MGGAEEVEVLVIGAGQAGIACSAHLARHAIPHLVVERARVAERWRSGRWDGLVANGPAWHDRFPDADFACPPDAFPGKEEVADYLAAYAARIAMPVRTGVEVTRLTRAEGGGFLAETTAGRIRAGAVISATGPFQRPDLPALVPPQPGLVQIHSAGYRTPGALPPGAVLVVGAGSSGAQIAEELARAGRRVILSVGPHGRPPRRYRGRDFVWWLGVLNLWDAEAPPTSDHVTIAVSGARGGQTVDFRRMAAELGVTLAGRVAGWDGAGVTFAPDLAANLARGDADHAALMRAADAWVLRNGADLPPDPDEWRETPDPPCVTSPLARLDLAAEGVGAIVWATGYGHDLGWMAGLAAVDAAGRPVHQRGVSAEPGVYFAGLSWQSRRGSAFIWGVWHDAAFVADHIARMRRYRAHAPAHA